MSVAPAGVSSSSADACARPIMPSAAKTALMSAAVRLNHVRLCLDADAVQVRYKVARRWGEGVYTCGAKKPKVLRPIRFLLCALY